MKSQDLDYVLTLAEERSFSKAAQKLFITQPSLSQFIKNLESRLDVELFDRSTSPIKLTYAGEIYVNAARRIQAILEEMDKQFTDLCNLEIGELIIGTTPFRASCLLPKSIVAFHQKFPGVHIHIVEEREALLQSALLEGNVDLSIMSGPVDEKVFYSETLAEEELYMAVPPDSPFNKGKEEYQITAEDIMMDTRYLSQVNPIDLSFCTKEKFILLHQEQKVQANLAELLAIVEFSTENILYTERLETAFFWTLAGIACSFIPDTLIRFGNYKKHPIYYKLNNSLAKRNIIVAFKKNRYLSKAASEYILLLKQLIGYGTWLPPTS